MKFRWRLGFAEASRGTKTRQKKVGRSGHVIFTIMIIVIIYIKPHSIKQWEAETHSF
jgi:hypothetical protein